MVACGLQSWCKECTKQYRDSRKDKQAAANREYYQKNRDILLEKAKEYREANKEAIKKKQKEYVLKNKEALDEYHKKYREENRKELVRRQSRYYKNRYHTDFSFCLIQRARALMGNALRKSGFSKSERTEKVLGCTPDFFKQHIERQFEKGMSWDNRDQWHLDHIIPISSAKTEQEIYALSHFTNIRPMWADENRSKGSRRVTLI